MLNFSINITEGELGPPAEIQAITIDASADGGAPVFIDGASGVAVIKSEVRIIVPTGGDSSIIIRIDEPPPGK